MSRTQRGSKAPGFEYWTARPDNKCGGAFNPNGNKLNKRRSSKVQRRLGTAEAKEIK